MRRQIEMLAGIKYCGGCNPTYDRGAACAEVRKAFSGECNGSNSINFEFAEAGGSYDILIVINGCHRRCADTGEYGYERLVSMWKSGQTEDVIGALLELQSPAI